MGSSKPVILEERSPNVLSKVQHGKIEKTSSTESKGNAIEGSKLRINNLLNGADYHVPKVAKPVALDGYERDYFVPPQKETRNVVGDPISFDPQLLPPQPAPEYPTPPIASIAKTETPPPTVTPCPVQFDGRSQSRAAVEEPLTDTTPATAFATSQNEVRKASQEVYILSRSIKGLYESSGIVEEHDVLGVYDTLEDANEAAPRRLGEGYFNEEDSPAQNKESLSDGRISIRAEDGEYVFELEVRKTTFYTRHSAQKPQLTNPAIPDQTKDVYVVWRTTTGDGIPSRDEVLGTYCTLEEANDAVVALQDKAFEGIEMEDNEKEVNSRGFITIKFDAGEGEYFEITVRKERSSTYIPKPGQSVPHQM